MYLYTVRLIIVQRELCRHFDITQAKAKDKVLKTDKQRRTYYDYTQAKIGALCLITTCVLMLKNSALKKLQI